MGDRVRHTTERGTQRVPRYQMPQVGYDSLASRLRRDVEYARLIARRGEIEATTPPEVPTGLSTTAYVANLGGGQYQVLVTLTWQIAPRAVLYIIERGSGAAPSEWKEVGQATGTSYQDGVGLAVGQTYSYRVVAVNAAGVRSAASASVTVTPQYTDAPPPPVNLRADFSGPDCVVTWDPPTGVVVRRYKVVVLDLSSVVKRTVYVSGTTWTYCYADNKTDFGGVGSPALKIEVSAEDTFGAWSAVASIQAQNPAPDLPTVTLECSLTQARWYVTSPLPLDFKNLEVALGSYQQVLTSTSGVIDLRTAGVTDGSSVTLSVLVRDVFDQASPTRQVQATAIYATKEDLTGNIFEVVVTSPQFPSGTDPKVLYDDNTSTGVAFTAAPTIMIEFPREEKLGLLRLNVSAAVDGYLQVQMEGQTDWTDVVGNATTPYSFAAGDNQIPFVDSQPKWAKRARLTLLSEVTVNEFWPDVYVVANAILGGTLQLTQGMYIQNADGTVKVQHTGIEVGNDTTGKTLLTPSGLAWAPPGGQESMYFRSARIGTALHGDTISLTNFAKVPKVALTPVRVPTFVPEPLLQPPTVQAVAQDTGGQLTTDGRSYTVRVCAYNEYGRTTATSVTVTMPVTDPIADSGSIDVSWSAVSGATGYQVFLGNSLATETTGTSYTITGAEGTVTSRAWQNIWNTLPTINTSGIVEQAMVLRTNNPSPTGFVTTAILVQVGSRTPIALSTTLYDVSNAYTSGSRQAQGYRISGTAVCKIYNTSGFPGPPGNVGVTLKLEGQKDGGEWQTLVSSFPAYQRFNYNPWVSGAIYDANTDFDLEVGDLALGNWVFKLTYVSDVLDNPNWVFSNNTPDVALHEEVWFTDKQLRTGEISYVALDGGE